VLVPALMLLALLYAFLAGFHTVFDFDMGWHLATGRWVVAHQAVPTTDVLSYTSPGAEWIYPPFAGVLLYGIFSAAGYAGLTWLCALVLAAIVTFLLRRSSQAQSAWAAALAILAVPALALRATPRADLFTHLFFAIFIALLWSYHEDRAEARSARLWLLPVLMLLWVNLHPGFVAGVGLIFAYLLVEALELFFPARRSAAVSRLRRASLPLAVAVVATLANPYGPKVFKAALQLAGVQPESQPGTGLMIGELEAVPLSFHALAELFDWRNPDSSFWWMVLAACVAVVIALWRRRPDAALLMASALYVAMQHQRYKGLFAIVVALVAPGILAEAFSARGAAFKRAARWISVSAALVLCLLTCVRIADLVTNRTYAATSNATLFGAGESWWFPERAAAFIEREHLPGKPAVAPSLHGRALDGDAAQSSGEPRLDRALPSRLPDAAVHAAATGFARRVRQLLRQRRNGSLAPRAL
jgi:hypothetical protein